MAGQDYSFLEVLNEGEAAGQGVNLSDRHLHAVYKSIKKLSNPRNASRGGLFTLDKKVEDVDLPPDGVQSAVKKLISDKLVVQIFRLDWSTESERIRVIPCFIAHGEDERNQVHTMYQSVLENSARSLENYLQTLARFRRDAFWKDLELDLKSDREPPDAEKMENSIVNLFKEVHAGAFDIIPNPSLLRQTRSDLEDELVSRGKMIHIPGYGVIPVREETMIDRFETADDFLENRVYPTYKERGGLKREFNEISMDEESYYIEDFVPKSTSYPVRRAESIKRVFNPEAADLHEPGKRFPGSLAVESVLAMASRVTRLYEDELREENNKLVRELRSRMLNPSATWSEMIVFFSQEEFQQIPPSVRDTLSRDSSILYGTWEQPDDTFHIFLRNDPYAFRQLVTGMSDLPSELSWQVLAMRHLLDKYDEHFEHLFKDPEFLTLYGKLLRDVYMVYMPFFHKLLIYIGIRIFQDRAFQLAKRRIDVEQQDRKIRNRAALADKEERRAREKKSSKEKARDLAVLNRIISLMDRRYFDEKRPPSLNDVKSEFSDMDDENFLRIIKEHFRQVPVRKEETQLDRVILYPVDHEWRRRAIKLNQALDEAIQELSERAPTDYEGKLMLDRARKVKAFIKQNGKSISAGKNREDAQDQEGAYKRFESEVRKYDEQNKPLDLAEQAEWSDQDD